MTRRESYTLGSQLHAPSPSTCTTSILVACQIARRFHAEVPTVAQLIAEFGMSRATAYRWRSVLKTAQGQP